MRGRAARICSRWSLALALILAVLPGGARGDAWTAPTAVTSVALDADTLRALGLEIVVQESVDSDAGAGATFRSVPPSLLAFRAPAGDFERFDSGALIHRGGFVLRGPAGVVHLDPLVLRVSEAGDDFDWVDAAGRRWFVLRDMQFAASFATQELRLENLSIHLAPELAGWLGEDGLAYAYVGTARIRLPALIPPSEASGGAGAGNCIETVGPIDVALTEMAQVSQVAREAGVRVALAPSAKLENVGVGTVAWFEAIQPLEFGGVGPHPYLSLSMFRVDASGSLVQLGLGGVKHAFFTVNTDCGCNGGHILYVGCTDTYGVSTNRNRLYLGPREEVSAFSGAWDRAGSHFDRCFTAGCDPATDDDDDFRDHQGDFPAGTHHDSFEHRLVVPEPELGLAGAAYFVDGWYVTVGDVDIFNGMGRRAVDPTLLSGVWTFPFVDSGIANGSVLDEIPGATLADLDTGEGQLQLAVTTTDLGGGNHHYEYALMNFDFDRQVDRIEVPIDAGIVVTNVDSRGLGDDPANDWTVIVGDRAISWLAPVRTGLDWGMLVSFGFDANAAPVASEVGLSVREAGAPTRFVFEAAAPVPEPSASLLAGVAATLLVGLRTRGVPR